MTVAQLFAAPRNVRKAEARLERAKSTIAAARALAAEISQQYAAQSLSVRPSVLQRHRLAKRLSAKSLIGDAVSMRRQ
jgi:hypothetical protein